MHSFIKSPPTLCAVFAACLIIVHTSCTNKLSSVSCANGGVNNSGRCVCLTGYQGENCQALSRTAFLGNWSVNEKGNITQASQYPVSIQSTGPNVNDITIKNLRNYFTTPVNAYAVITDLSVPYQQIQGASIQGSGYLTQATSGKNIIVINYTVTNLTTNASIAEVDTLQ